MWLGSSISSLSTGWDKGPLVTYLGKAHWEESCIPLFASLTAPMGMDLYLKTLASPVIPIQKHPLSWLSCFGYCFIISRAIGHSAKKTSLKWRWYLTWTCNSKGTNSPTPFSHFLCLSLFPLPWPPTVIWTHHRVFICSGAMMCYWVAFLCRALSTQGAATAAFPKAPSMQESFGSLSRGIISLPMSEREGKI